MKRALILSVALGCMCLAACDDDIEIPADGRLWEATYPDAWTYPVVPGTDEWLALGSTQARVDACQIPQSVLDTVSTGYLAHLCLDYPFASDIWAFNILQDGVEHYFDDCNGLRELVERPDRFAILTDLYLSGLAMQDTYASLDDLLERGDYVTRVALVEVIMGSPRMNLTDEECVEALTTLNFGYRAKWFDEFSIWNPSNTYARTNMVERLSPGLLEREGLGGVISTGWLSSEDDLDRFNRLCASL